MSTTKRLVVLLLTLAVFGSAACADASGPRPDTAPCTESQGSGGRSCQ
jgi:hypothetical protein